MFFLLETYGSIKELVAAFFPLTYLSKLWSVNRITL